jgi:hypothetical protein
MPSIDPDFKLSNDDRERLLDANLTRPVRIVKQGSGYGQRLYDLEMPAHDLAAMSTIELVDWCDRSVSNHFGGKADRTSATTATVTVWID